jgi:hypothetical protein
MFVGLSATEPGWEPVEFTFWHTGEDVPALFQAIPQKPPAVSKIR